MSKGKLFVISGASGVGKSTVLSRVMKSRPDLSFSVSATTRAPRAGEVDGVSYYFVTKDKFQEMIAQHAFLEYDAHMDNYYGTPRAQLEKKLESGSVILDIEHSMSAVKRKTPYLFSLRRPLWKRWKNASVAVAIHPKSKLPSDRQESLGKLNKANTMTMS